MTKAKMKLKSLLETPIFKKNELPPNHNVTYTVYRREPPENCEDQFESLETQ